MKEFLIIRLSSLGDIIHTLPAFAALRQSFPQARISWATGPGGKEILEMVRGVDRIITWPDNLFRSCRQIRNREAVVLDFQGLLKSALLGALSGAKRRLGFNRVNLKEPLARFFYTENIPAVAEMATHVIYKNLRLLKPLGIRWEEENLPLMFPLELPDSLVRQVREKLEALGYKNGQPLLIFNVGASWESKRLSAVFWSELIKATQEKISPAIKIFLLWGNKEEMSLAEAIHKDTGIPLLPFLTIKEVVALINLASVIVSGDTFALQAASALGRPSVGLFGPTSPTRNGPIGSHDEVIYAGVDCSPCYRRTCPTPRCWQSLSARKASEIIIRQVERYA